VLPPNGALIFTRRTRRQNAKTRKPEAEDKTQQGAASASQDIPWNKNHVKNLETVDGTGHAELLSSQQAVLV